MANQNREALPDFKAIKARVSCEAVLTKHGALEGLRRQGNKLIGPSPLRPDSDGSDSFNVNLEKNNWYDFGIDKGGNVLDLEACFQQGVGYLMLSGNAKNKALIDAARALQDLAGASDLVRTKNPPVAAQNTASRVRDVVSEGPQPKAELKPLGFKLPLDAGHEQYLDFLQDRGFSPADLEPFGAGWYEAKKGKGVMHRRICFPLSFPIIEGQLELVGYAGRAVDQENIETGGKWKLPPRFPKDQFLFGFPQLDNKALTDGAPLFVVEGILDVVAVHRAGGQAIAVLGSSVIEGQDRLIRDLNPKIVKMLFDGGDRAFENALGSGGSLLALGLTVQVLRLPNTEDPASLSVEALRAVLRGEGDFPTL